MEVVKVHPAKIKIREGMERYRQEIGDVSALAKSIKDTRQILPIIISRDYELIDGGRRLAACMLAGVDAKCVFEDVIDDAEMRELEIEANCHRKDFTPAERALAIRDLHGLKQARHGIAVQGQVPGAAWTVQQTADSLNISRAAVNKQLEIAQMVDAFPELKGATKATQIVKAAKGMQRFAAAVVGAKAHEAACKTAVTPFTLLNIDSLEYMLTIPDKHFDILLTDPIYGIDADKVAIGVGGVTGGDITTSGFTISDRKKDAYRAYKILAKESFRFCKDDAHGYVFVGPEHVYIVSKIFRKHGWLVHVKPLIWIKREVGQCNAPHAWPSSCYETLLYIRKQESKLVKEGQPDWVDIPPVTSSNKTHPFEKPVELWSNLISRSALPGQKVFDPFMGSGSSAEASFKYRLFYTGIDLSVEAFYNAQARMAAVVAASTK